MTASKNVIKRQPAEAKSIDDRYCLFRVTHGNGRLRGYRLQIDDVPRGDLPLYENPRMAHAVARAVITEKDRWHHLTGRYF